MIGFRSSIVAVFALGSALILGGVGVTRAQAQTQPQTQAQPQPQTQPRPQVQAQAPATPTAGLASPLAVHSLDRLSATRERPLFSPSRRAPAPPPPPPPIIRPPPPPPEPPNVTLVGIIKDAEEARAIVQSGPKNEVRRVRIGDDIGGWKVAQIESRRLVLKLDSRLATFSMFSGHRNPAPRAAPKAVPPRTAPQPASRPGAQPAPRAGAQPAPQPAPRAAPEVANADNQSLVGVPAPTQGSPGRRGHDD
jgi:hypothetical protein